MRSRYFSRLPATDTLEEALDAAARLGGERPVLHRCDSDVIVGSVELPAPREPGQ